MVAWAEPNAPSLLQNVTENHKVCSSASCTPPVFAYRCSCSMVFGTWEPLEVEALLDIPECPCVVDVSAAIRLINTDSVALRGFSNCKADQLSEDNDDCNIQNSITYHEWISRRQPVSLPPGLPRPPRLQQAPCIYAAIDDDLEEDCDEWYSRNVASGNFPDWMRQEQVVQQPQAAPSVAAASTASLAHGVGAGCTDDDLDVECEEWFSRNVTAGLFSSWLTPASAADACTASTTPASPSETVDSACSDRPQEVVEAAAAISTSSSAATRSGAVRFVCSVAVGDFGGLTEDCTLSAPNSPAGSDCRATSEEAGSSSSRSSSSLSLGSMDTRSDSCSEEGDEVDVESRGDMALAVELPFGLCQGCVEGQWPGYDTGMCTGTLQEAGVELLHTVECTSWEEEVEALLRSSAAAICGPSAVQCLVAVMPTSRWEEGAKPAPRAGWLEEQLPLMLAAVVSRALFGEEDTVAWL